MGIDPNVEDMAMGISPYVFCWDNPITNIDPDGRLVIAANSISSTALEYLYRSPTAQNILTGIDESPVPVTFGHLPYVQNESGNFAWGVTTANWSNRMTNRGVNINYGGTLNSIDVNANKMATGSSGLWTAVNYAFELGNVQNQMGDLLPLGMSYKSETTQYNRNLAGTIITELVSGGYLSGKELITLGNMVFDLYRNQTTNYSVDDYIYDPGRAGNSGGDGYMYDPYGQEWLYENKNGMMSSGRNRLD
ncbi:MAG: hypothetical protein A2268_06845 [Candidatus Raymondbacteria bacterium RifOxyA12_full_50_37]|nr:MAG: hypothetical protein A2268_06845 [Candidatus Raymondbacteria bacterium RifOxyA12_full_50_37]OGJ96570.1 MAG: hypothetical protein A2453_03390 [Candidatus Raymondbacteria bacterium RIFOXYC2_FULL_50_21]OGJ99665.1 MAG: hypothetical protein A2487_17285 [Candidatus Raymondbacteria bacterium RifOxyC12_full_50_8]